MSSVPGYTFENDAVDINHAQTGQAHELYKQQMASSWNYMQSWAEPDVIDPVVYNALMELVANLHPPPAVEGFYMPEVSCTNHSSVAMPPPFENKSYHANSSARLSAVTSESRESPIVPTYHSPNVNDIAAAITQEVHRATAHSHAPGDNMQNVDHNDSESTAPLINVYPSFKSNPTSLSYRLGPQPQASSTTNSPSSMIIHIEPASPADYTVPADDPLSARCCWLDCDWMILKDRRCISHHLRTVHMLDLRKHAPRLRCQWLGCRSKPMNAENLARHITTSAGHLTEKDHRCNSCLKLYLRQDMLERHRRRCPLNKQSAKHSKGVRKMKVRVGLVFYLTEWINGKLKRWKLDDGFPTPWNDVE